jgi:penicillin-binding protein A
MKFSRLASGITVLSVLAASQYRPGAHAAGPEFLPPASQVQVSEHSRARLDPVLFSGGSFSGDSTSHSWSEKRSITHLLPPLERLALSRVGGSVRSSQLPLLSTRFAGKFAALNEKNEFVFFTIKPTLQQRLEEVVKSVRAPHVAAVVIDPSSGKILAIAGRSSSVRNIEVHAGFPAASLFKIITAAAAVEKTNISSDTTVRFRGGDYTLSKWNYLPGRSDNRVMNVGVAMGKSCNPVFGRLALNNVGAKTLREYAEAFGFNGNHSLDIPVPQSKAFIPSGGYELSRTGAGFGDVTISPVHAAALAAGVANGGKLPRPTLIDKIISPEGEVLFRSTPEVLSQMVKEDTARELVEMMKYTTINGTSSKQFRQGKNPVFANLSIAAKTGTLRGKNPEGLNTWFIAAAPAHEPEYALSVIVVDPQSGSSRASAVGRQIFDRLFHG